MAHPRAGGENRIGWGPLRGREGSSPRGRGKLTVTGSAQTKTRLIPARAGKTQLKDVELDRLWAHPRAGGENSTAAQSCAPRQGSSPRGRGKPCGLESRDVTVRLIPARAGKTLSPDDQALADAAHPRAGGENKSDFPTASQYLGSSPRGRGKREFEHGLGLCVGLIPARAGKTFAASQVRLYARAHPRAGGGNPTVNLTPSTRRGSSPRGRGKPVAAHRVHFAERLIPARAGKTRSWASPCRSHPAHPRAGGENQVGCQRLKQVCGSSPRGRGKRAAFDPDCAGVGLIPARAGKT